MVSEVWTLTQGTVLRPPRSEKIVEQRTRTVSSHNGENHRLDDICSTHLALHLAPEVHERRSEAHGVLFDEPKQHSRCHWASGRINATGH